MKFEIFKPHALFEQGKVSMQADSIFPAMGEATIHDRLFVVADGMGELAKGKLASKAVCQALADYFFQVTCPDEPCTDSMLAEAFEAAKSRVNDSCPQGGAASVAMLYFHRHGCLAAHVGHCCIYHIRPKTRSLLYKSAGHEGSIAAKDPKAVVPTVAHITNVRYGDYFLLLSQGAADAISDNRVIEMVCAKMEDEYKVEQFKVALEACGDNHSAYLIRVSGVMQEALDEHLHDDEQQLMKSANLQQTPSAAVPRAAQPSSAAQPSRVAQPSHNVQPSNGAQPSRAAQPSSAAHSTHSPQSSYSPQPKEEKKGGAFVTVLAALATLAILAGTLFYFGRSKKEPEPEIVEEVVKKDTIKKDTVNVMEVERNKVKKDTTKVEKPEKSAYRAPEPDSVKVEDIDSDIPTVLDAPSSSGEPTEPSTRQQQEPTTTPPATSTSPTTSPTTTAPANPNQVTPRPVIPEDE